MAPKNGMYEIRPSPGKGFGVFARRPIRKGTAIVREGPVLQFPKATKLVNDDELQEAFNKLSAEDQEGVLQLYQDEARNGETKLSSIFQTNAYTESDAVSEEVTSNLYLTVSRFNHACVSNADKRLGYVVALKDVAEDEEIFTCYSGGVYETLTSLQRKVLFNAVRSFECTCLACRPSDFRQLSNMRRSLIFAIRCALDGQSALGLKEAEELGVPIAYPPRRGPLTAVEEIEYTIYLAHLREADEQPMSAAEAYADGARLLMEYINRDVANLIPDVLPIVPTQVVKLWMHIALSIAKSVSMPDDRTLRDMQRSMNNMEQHTLFTFSDALATKMPTKLYAKVYAMKMTIEDGMFYPDTELSREEYEDMVRQRNREVKEEG